MKKLAIVFVTLLAAAPLAQGKILKAYNGDIDFDHSLHMGLFPCKECHEGAPRPFGINKQSGHKLCLGCHKKVGKGPAVHCSECHKLNSGDR
jgi:predicted CXXCH cytochrome family protein